MREILFRGKRTDNGEWIEGLLVELGRESFSDPVRYGIVNKAIPTYGSNFDLSVYYNLKIVEIISKTVGQYTGLTDKNGTKIFEGDIIRWHDNTELSVGGQIAEVCFGKYMDADRVFDDIYPLGFYIRFSDKNCVTISCLDEYKNYFDIIGNTYDNPGYITI